MRKNLGSAMSPRSATSFAQRAIMEDSDYASEAKLSQRGTIFHGIKLENVPMEEQKQ